MGDVFFKQTDLLTPNGVRDSPAVSGVSREQIRLLISPESRAQFAHRPPTLFFKQTDLLTPNGVRDSPAVRGVSREQIRLLISPESPMWSISHEKTQI